MKYSLHSQEIITKKLPQDSTKLSLMQQFDHNQHMVKWDGIKIKRDKMPIFCKWELDIEDKSKIPLKFRLGSVDYVNRLEQKSPHY